MHKKQPKHSKCQNPTNIPSSPADLTVPPDPRCTIPGIFCVLSTRAYFYYKIKLTVPDQYKKEKQHNLQRRRRSNSPAVTAATGEEQGDALHRAHPEARGAGQAPPLAGNPVLSAPTPEVFIRALLKLY